MRYISCSTLRHEPTMDRKSMGVSSVQSKWGGGVATGVSFPLLLVFKGQAFW